jgi:hypothetical protein
MTEGLLPDQALAGLSAEKVSPGLIALVGDEAPTRMILLAGAGSFECAHVTMTQGVYVGDASDPAHEIRSRLDQVQSRTGEVVPGSGWEQYKLELSKAGLVMEDATAQ